MFVMIVQKDAGLGAVWKAHLCRHGAEVTLCDTPQDALTTLRKAAPDVIILDLDLPDGGASDVAMFASYRHPQAKVICVTAQSFFSGPSAFEMIPNAQKVMPADLRPDDLCALVDHYGAAAQTSP